MTSDEGPLFTPPARVTAENVERIRDALADGGYSTDSLDALAAELEAAKRENAQMKNNAEFAIELTSRAEAAERERDDQMNGKLEAQVALMAITESLALTLSEMGNGWKEGVFHILARIEEIVDQANVDAARAEAAERERDEAREEVILANFDGHYARAEAAERERDEWKQEAHLSKWPKEAAQEYHHMKVALPAAEAALAVAQDALRRIANFIAMRHKEGDIEYQAVIIARAALAVPADTPTNTQFGSRLDAEAMENHA